MSDSFRRVSAALFFWCLTAVGLSGCATLTGESTLGYYWQAVRGHISMMQAAKPIPTWMADPQTPEALKRRLKLVSEIREFASRELGLPDNGSYRSYADLKRPFVVWNVVATPELSLKAQQWCFPVAGCVTYKGYYSKEAADAFAKQLREKGFDVQVAGVPAYSTLGYLDDPVLNTFINYPDAELARLIFHELAHQLIYVKNDTQFNESFATAVESMGVERWIKFVGDPKVEADYRAYAGRRADFVDLLMRTRTRLEQAYGETPAGDGKPNAQVKAERETKPAVVPDEAAKRAAKALILSQMQAEYQQLKRERWNGFAGYDRFFQQQLGNAHLAAVATYNEWVPSFKALAARKDNGNDLKGFYEAVRQLAKLDKEERDAALRALKQ